MLFLAHRHVESQLDRELSIKLTQQTNTVLPMPLPVAPLTPEIPPSVEAPSQIDDEGQPSDLQRVFEDAPLELASMSSASLPELFAGKTQAQAAKLLEQHRGKSVRVSGVVESVELPGMTQGNGKVTIRAAVLLLLFFDADKDIESQLLALNIGDSLTVSGQIHTIAANLVALDKCKIIEARGQAK